MNKSLKRIERNRQTGACEGLHTVKRPDRKPETKTRGLQYSREGARDIAKHADSQTDRQTFAVSCNKTSIK